ncbi:hypothetical protein DYH09_09840 [bacterium CPR1]|nr:hypothetical protein [bacterium CPR1]
MSSVIKPQPLTLEGPHGEVDLPGQPPDGIATRLLASRVGSFYLEHGAMEEGVRHLLWGEPPELLASQRALKASQSATA